MQMLDTSLRIPYLTVWGGTQESVFCFIFILFFKFVLSCRNLKFGEYCSTTLSMLRFSSIFSIWIALFQISCFPEIP